MLPELPRVWLRIDLGWAGDRWEVRTESSREPTGWVAPSVRPGPSGAPPQLELLDLPLGRIEEELRALGAELAGQEATEAAGGVPSPVWREGTLGPPATIPVFVRAAPSLLAARVDVAVADALPDEWRERVTVVAERPVARTPPPRPTLPLRATIVGDDPGSVADELNDQTHWFRRALDLVETNLVVAGGPRSGPTTAHVVVVERAQMMSVLEPLTARLVIDLGEPSIERVSPTVGTYLAVRDLDEAARFLQSLTHDQPFHDAFLETVGPRTTSDVMLASSPEALHDLRLTGIHAEYAELRTTMESGVPLRDERETATSYRLLWDDGHRFATSDVEAGPLWGDEMADDHVVRGEISFDQESNGLLPLYERLRNAREATRRQQVTAEGRTRTFEVADEGVDPDKRVVDVTMWRDPSVPGVSVDPRITAGTTLQRGGRYAIQVRIGQPSSHSLVADDVPPIGSLLPTQEDGHDLEVVCFPGDFVLEGPARTPLFLPPLAPSTDVAEFQLRAPADDGPAAARIGVYHENNLVQSLLLTATVTPVEELRESSVGPRATLDHHATRDWEHLDLLGPRDVSFAVNSDGRSHRVYALDEEDSADWSLPPDVQEALAGPVRTALEGAIDIPPSQDLRDLARAGRAFFLAVFDQLGPDPEARSMLRRLRERSDQVLQIVRADVHQSLPWSLVYDWPIPDGDVELCLGVIAADDTCGHTKDSGVVCARGFWGIRHLLEELVGTRESPPLEIEVGDAKIGFDVATWADDDFVKTLLAEAASHAEVTRIDSTESLLERIWQRDRAPVCAVIGHFEDEAIHTGTSEVEIAASDIAEYSLDHGDLTDPHPLVMLLVCESGAVTPNDTASHALSLVSAGVAGLVATECSVWTSQVQRFGTRLLEAMAELVDADRVDVPFPMAAAVRTARTRVVAEEVIAGLAFACFGPASVRFVRERAGASP